MKVNRKKWSYLLLAAGLVIYVIILGRLHAVEKTQMVSTIGYTYEKAEVLQVITDNLQENGTRAGFQYLQVRLLTGEQKGTTTQATSADGNLFGAVCTAGDHVIVTVSQAGDSSTISVYGKDRTWTVLAFMGIFLALICLIGGKNGMKSVLGLVFTCLSVIYLLFPMIYMGYSPFWSAVLVCAVTTVATMFLIGGTSVKTLSAVLGTVLGVLMAGISAFLFGLAADIDGYNVSNIETLIYVGQNTKIQIGGLLFAGILIAALGAVMDVAMSVSSAIYEIDSQSPGLSWRALFSSGMHVGRDMMGTMSNTLILAFAGGSLSLLMIDYAYNLPFMQLINSYSIGIEIMQGVAGSIGVIMTVPFVAVIMSGLLVWKRNKKQEV